MRVNTPVTGHEVKLADDDVILSKTNLTGHITYVNDTLIRITGFDEQELVGAPHNIFRHPDMPPEAFQDLWDTIRAGRNWRGFVKNRCKNGDYYWVDASVTPNYEDGRLIGYTSYRVRPEHGVVAQVERLYKDLRDGRAGNVQLSEGRAVRRGLFGLARGLRPESLTARLTASMLLIGLIGVAGTIAGMMDLVDHTVLVATVVLTGGAAGLYAWQLLGDMRRGLGNAIRIMQGVSSGNFNQRVDNDRRDEIGQLMGSLRNMVGNLRETITKVNAATDSVTVASSEIAAGNDDLSQRTSEQAASLEETASSMEQMTATVKRNAENARGANELAADASSRAREGGEVLGETVVAMQAINDSSSQIADIIGVIDEIAFQTNLLALNAAVESARAGEHGRGFAVVAAEVRNLAQRSSTAANEIKSLIAQSVDKARAGSEVVEKSSGTLSAIIESVAKVSEMVSEIAAASEEQAAGIDQVNKAVGQMDQMTQQNAALVEEAAANAKSMEDLAVDLKMVTGYFTLAGSETESARTRVRAARAARQAPPRAAAPRPRLTAVG